MMFGSAIRIVGCGELANRINHGTSHANDAVCASQHSTELPQIYGFFILFDALTIA
jgi:hypothetical protein